MQDFLIIAVGIIAVFFVLKIAFKALKVVLLLGIAAVIVYYLTNFGFLEGLF
ncbi:MAG TPA: hypothetical protein VFD33_03745 [Bacillota bacterium]|nr:hypothetical protein [Bacillota bacterium]